MVRIAISLMLAGTVSCSAPSPSTAASPPGSHAAEPVTTPGGGANPQSVIGVWRGTSQCKVRPSPCNDEIVVYHISAGADPDAFVLVANKIVGGQEEEMGTLHCQLQRPTDRLTCRINKGTFFYEIDGDRMHGTLDLSDGTRYREIEVERVR